MGTKHSNQGSFIVQKHTDDAVGEAVDMRVFLTLCDTPLYPTLSYGTVKCTASATFNPSSDHGFWHTLKLFTP